MTDITEAERIALATIPPEAGTRDIITQQQLLDLLHYDKDTGIFTWARPVRNNSILPGTIAGAINSDGYVRIEIGGRTYMAHRLAWLYMIGCWPNGLIDHIDSCRSNNRFSNLRVAKVSENGWNCKLYTTNSSGVKGVHWHKTNKKWYARFRVNGREVHVGTFDTLEAAREAVQLARAVHHGCFANDGKSPSPTTENTNAEG